MAALLRSPLLRASATSCATHAAGDALCQTVAPPSAGPGEARAGASGAEAFDAGRCARFAAVGATLHGPFFHHAFGALERHVRVGGAPWRAVVAKTAVGQFTALPLYLTLFFPYMSVLEGVFSGEGAAEPAALAAGAAARLADNFVPTMVAGTAFWPAANLVNFSVVPANMRVAYVGSVGVVWNVYLSWRNAREAGGGRG